MLCILQLVACCSKLINAMTSVANPCVALLAGYETTSMALTYALYELSKNPALQQKVVDEVDRFGRDRTPGLDDLASFSYIDAVLKEAMRLHPPVTPLVALVSSCHNIV